MKKNVYSYVLLFLCISVKAQVGQLDNTFTKSGFVKTSMGADYLPFNNVAVKAFPQTDGKILFVYESAGMTLIAKKKCGRNTGCYLPEWRFLNTNICLWTPCGSAN